MSTVADVYNSNPAAAMAQAQTQSLMGDTQDRFLALLVTQLQNQDPLNPMDNAQVTSQIAQLSMVNGIQQLNNTLLALSGQMDMSQSLQASGLIGKSILYPGEKVLVGSDPNAPDLKTTTPFGIDLMSSVEKITIVIRDNSGQMVRSWDEDPKRAGVYALAWDGKNDGGVPVPDTAYSVAVQATDTHGQPVSAQVLTYGHVNSVAYTTEGLKLNLAAGEKISLLDIRQVMQ